MAIKVVNTKPKLVKKASGLLATRAIETGKSISIGNTGELFRIGVDKGFIGKLQTLTTGDLNAQSNITVTVGDLDVIASENLSGVASDNEFSIGNIGSDFNPNSVNGMHDYILGGDGEDIVVSCSISTTRIIYYTYSIWEIIYE